MTWISSTTWTELSLLGVAFLLCGAIGLERQISQKSAGLRTHTLVGMGSAGFTLVSAYGFSSVLGDDVLLDPSRIAAQIVSGVGFLGAGVIFMRRDVVRGLTTAASIWLTAAVGMAAGAGMIVMAGAMTILHLIAIVILAPISKHLPSRDNRLYTHYSLSRRPWISSWSLERCERYGLPNRYKIDQTSRQIPTSPRSWLKCSFMDDHHCSC